MRFEREGRGAGIAAQERIGGNDAQTDYRHEQHRKEQRDRADHLDGRQQKRAEEARATSDEDGALPRHHALARALLRSACCQAFDRAAGKGRREVTGDGLPHGAWRREREPVGCELRQDRAQGVRPEPVGCEHEVPRPCSLPQEAVGETLPRRRRAGRYRLGRRQRALEWHSAALGQRAIVVVRIEPAIGDQHVMGVDPPLRGKRARPPERRGVKEAAQEEVVFGRGWSCRVCGDAQP